MKTQEEIDGVFYDVTWRRTGNKIDVIDCYDWTEILEGEDQFGNIWEATGDISIEEIVSVEDPALVEKFKCNHVDTKTDYESCFRGEIEIVTCKKCKEKISERIWR